MAGLPLLAVVSLAGSAQLNGLRVEAASLEVDAITDWRFSFTPFIAVPDRGEIRVEFPTGFSLPAGASECAIDAPGVSSVATIIDSATRLRCVLGPADHLDAQVPVGLTLRNVRNARGAATGHSIAVQTFDNSSRMLEAGRSPEVRLEPRILADTTIEPLYAAAGKRDTWTIRFAPSMGLQGGDRVMVGFPDGFEVEPDVACQMGAPPTASNTETLTISRQEVRCTIGPSDMVAAGQELALHVVSVRNPPHSGSTGGFSVEVRSEDGSVRERAPTLGAEIQPRPFSRAPTVDVVDRETGARTMYRINFTTVNAWSPGGAIEVEFPTGIGVLTEGPRRAEARLVSPLSEGLLLVDSRDQVLRFERPGGGERLPGGTTVTLAVGNVFNPLLPDPVPGIRTATLHSNGQIVDEGTTEPIEFVPAPPERGLRSLSGDGPEARGESPTLPFLAGLLVLASLAAAIRRR